MEELFLLQLEPCENAEKKLVSRASGSIKFFLTTVNYTCLIIIIYALPPPNTVKGEIIEGLNNCVFADIWFFKH